MLRQRLRSETSPLVALGRVLVVVLALALVWYGLMLVALALKFAPGDVNAISGYRDAYDALAGLAPGDVSGTLTRAVVAGCGLLGFVLFGWLALKELPRPYLARGDLHLHGDDHGHVTVAPRAVERLAETAAASHAAVSAASGRFGGDDLAVSIAVGRASGLAETLPEVRSAVAAALQRHGLPPVPVNVTLTGLHRQRTRELE